MKRILTVILFSLVALISSGLSVDPDKTPQEVYIERYYTLAVEEMYRSGVPASITLAQGLLESRSGLSDLALRSNNHFGIKCHNWAGAKIYYDDDKANECFRSYASVEDSFKDHSDFLRYRDRYKFLFDLDITDYKGWAYGLRKAGYATDPAYPTKLIRLIEEYGLYLFDTLPSGGVLPKDDKADKNDKAERKAAKKKRKTTKKASRKELPESPNKIEQPKRIASAYKESFSFPLSRQMYSQNGVPFIYAAEGETYESIAASYNLFLKEILKFNDLDVTSALKPGEVVYLHAKKNKAAYGLDKYIAEESGVSLREIAQRFAVKLDALCKMNNVTENYILREGEVLKLRK